MLSPKTKQQISSLWDMFWSGGMTNPLTSIEQITYLIFLKRLEKLDQQRLAAGKRSIYGPRFNCDLDHHFLDGNDIDKRLPEGANPDDYCVGHGTCRWRYLRDLSRTTDSETGRDITPYDHMNGYVFPWLRALHDTLKQHNSNGTSISSAPMEDAFFQFPKDKTAIFQKAIARVDELFAHVGESREDDIMGDIFEYLLSQLQISGKNGQFRTPRHIIRFLIELAPPEAGQRIIDPTAGTAGFLINSIDYLKKSFTSAEQLILEWDGTPHNHIHDKIPPTEWEKAMQGQLFVGYDNDRTMARIGWMNMILHGIENPHIQLRDSLGKALTREESGTYHRVYANPPYTGTIDRNDLYLTIDRFPKNPRKANEAITYKTELLFTWLILDLLVPGGKAAVIVPEGVLFGSTGAHKELRRQLLFNHNLEAVISLPPGIFNPYTGVKTSVLVFQKGGDITQKGRTPRTERVWFYDVSNDGYSSGAKREPDYTKNDLWDALYKWQQKMFDESTDYFQPEIYPARWRPVDENVIKIFPELKKYGGKDADITELFGFPPLTDPKEIEQQIIESQRPRIATLYEQRLEATEAKLAREGNGQRTLNKTYERDLNQLDQLFHTAIDSMLENKRQYSTNPTYGRECLRPILGLCWEILSGHHVTKSGRKRANGERGRLGRGGRPRAVRCNI